MPRTVLRPLPGDEQLSAGREVAALADRLWPKVAGPWYSTAEYPISDDDCWDWISTARAGIYRVRNGRRVLARPRRGDVNYGRISRGRRAEGTAAAHVAAYEVTYGPVQAGLQVRHACGRSLCCNPRHLVTGTVAENGSATFHSVVRKTKQLRRRGKEPFQAQEVVEVPVGPAPVQDLSRCVRVVRKGGLR